MPYKDMEKKRAWRRAYIRTPGYKILYAEYRRKFKERHPAIKRQYETTYCLTKREFLAKQKNGPCTDCKQTFPIVCMDFDHAREKKEFNISGRVRSLKRLAEEIKKCDLVCSNCHRIRTEKRRISCSG